MANFKNDVQKAFRKALLNEARILPSDADIASCPSIYKGVKECELGSYIEKGFQHQLAGGGGTAVGEGVYSRLELDGALRCLSWYGPSIIQGKVLGGFRNYIMFDAGSFPSIRHQVERYYGANISPADQVRSIVKDPNDANRIIDAEKSMNNYSHIAKLCRKYGIRGMMYEWDGVATVLPFDFASIVVWAVAKNARIDARLVKVFDREARERYERNFDWDFQLWGRYDSYDRTKITRVQTNNEMYALVRDNSRGYNFVELDTNIVANPQPKEISNVWFRTPPTFPSIKTGIFSFTYMGREFFATVFLPGENTPALWFPEDVSKLFSPNLASITDWVDFDLNTLNEVIEEIKKIQQNDYASLNVSESLKNTFRTCLNETINEEIRQNNAQDFLSQNSIRLYKTVFQKDLVSIFKYGQLRQFASMNDSWYSEGVYTCLSPNSLQFGRYGDCKLEMVLVGGFRRFLIFDEKWAKRVYGANYTIEGQYRTLLPPEIAEKEIAKIKHRFGDTTYLLTSGRTVDVLNMMFHDGKGRYSNHDGEDASYYNKLFSKYDVRGAVYHGWADGFCAVCWNFNDVVPYRYSLDGGHTWKTDLFNFEEAKERTSINGDAVKRFRYKYYNVDDTFIKCNVGGKTIAVTCVETTPHKFNIISLKNGEKISPIDFDRKPLVGMSGIFSFVYRGVSLKGIVLLPGDNSGGVWYPEDITLLNDRPNISNLNDWVDFRDLDEVVNEIKSM